MKIRTGFVSNSSSSSFCILGRRVNNLPKEFVPENKFLAIATDNNGEGDIILHLDDEEFYNYFRERPYKACLVEGIMISNGSRIDKDTIPYPAEAIVGTCQNWTPRTVHEFCETQDEEEEHDED